jgi:hypothetical protein
VIPVRWSRLPLTTFPRKVRQDIETEGQRLLAFIAGDTTTRDVV